MPWKQLPEAPKAVVDALCGKPRILVDENLGEGVASFLRDQGCNVEFADDVGLAPAFPPVRSNISMAREAPQKAEKVLRWHIASSAAEPKVATGIAAPNSDIAIFKQHLLDEGLILAAKQSFVNYRRRLSPQ